MLGSFGRRYERLLLPWRDSELARYRAMGRNLLHDQRIHDGLIALFQAMGDEPSSTEALQERIQRYFKCVVQMKSADEMRSEPDFADVRTNRANILTRSDPAALPSLAADADTSAIQDGEFFINPTTVLARTINLGGLGTVLHSLGSQFPLLHDVPADRTELVRWLDAQLGYQPGGAPDLARADPLLTTIFDAMTESRRCKGNSCEPVWCTSWNRLQPHLAGPAVAWTNAVGIPADEEETWIVVLRYRLDEVPSLSRPTQLHVAWQKGEEHFPPPPDAPRTEGGHPVYADPANPLYDLGLLPEWIHPQIHHRIEHWHLAGRKIGRRTGGRCMFEERRRRHYSLLSAHYGPAVVKNWMETPL